MDGVSEALAKLVSDELVQPVSDAVSGLAQAIRSRTGPGTAAVLFYGSCLRKRSEAGVLDFYVLVDGYREANPGRRLALANALLPPNVFYIEHASPGGALLRVEDASSGGALLRVEDASPGGALLRAKYAVVSLRDFERGAAGRWLRTGIWARFSQPVRAVYLRDAAARSQVVAACVESVIALLERTLPLLAGEGDRIRTSAAELWQTAFRETYAAEMRPETAEGIRGLYLDQPARYERAAELAVRALEARGALRVSSAGDPIEVELPAGERRRRRRRARLRRPHAKLAYVAQLLKTAFTFGDWLPYALWKLERHSGERLVPSERQRRHPILFGLPLLVRALRMRALR